VGPPFAGRLCLSSWSSKPGLKHALRFKAISRPWARAHLGVGTGASSPDASPRHAWTGPRSSYLRRERGRQPQHRCGRALRLKQPSCLGRSARMGRPAWPLYHVSPAWARLRPRILLLRPARLHRGRGPRPQDGYFRALTPKQPTWLGHLAIMRMPARLSRRWGRMQALTILTSMAATPSHPWV
jgi:hypothetical protein